VQRACHERVEITGVADHKGLWATISLLWRPVSPPGTSRSNRLTAVTDSWHAHPQSRAAAVNDPTNCRMAGSSSHINVMGRLTLHTIVTSAYRASATVHRYRHSSGRTIVSNCHRRAQPAGGGPAYRCESIASRRVTIGRPRMPDDVLLHAPLRQPASPCEAAPVFEVWRLGRGAHCLICSLRNEQVTVDVVTLAAERSPLLFQRCASHAHAQFVAMSYRRTFLREGWTERR